MFRHSKAMYALYLPMVAAAVALFTSVGAAQSASSSLQTPLRLTALAVRTVGESMAAPVTITLQRWSTNAEAEQWMTNMREATPRKMLDTLASMPSIGRVASPGTVGVDLRFARSEAVTNTGRQRITIAADRQMSFWERADAPRSTDYPFMLIDIQLDAKGEGSGRVIAAAKIVMDQVSKTLIIENFESQPVLLQSVKLAKG